MSVKQQALEDARREHEQYVTARDEKQRAMYARAEAAKRAHEAGATWQEVADIWGVTKTTVIQTVGRLFPDD